MTKLWARFGQVGGHWHGPAAVRMALALGLPVLALAVFALGGAPWLLGFAMTVPLCLVLSGRGTALFGPVAQAGGTGDLVAAMDRALAQPGVTAACYVVLFHELPKLRMIHGPAGIDALMRGCLARVTANSRQTDRAVRLDDSGIALFLTVTGTLDPEATLNRASRLMQELGQPIPLGQARMFPAMSVGFAMSSRLPLARGQALLDGARVAAEDAFSHGNGAIRGYDQGHMRRSSAQSALHPDLERALTTGQIRPWFQPQISADTLAISGAEALARWVHPERGLIAPADFLPMIAASGQSENLTRLILSGSLDALVQWDRAGLRVPFVGINLSAEDLRNPRLPDILAWELDRYRMPPERLTVEILEDVAARSADDMITRNLARISGMGCGIDMDDFGTGQTSIANIQRLSVRRIKIDRSFVARVDSDAGQKRMIAAILSMTERLGLCAVAEGVETPAEFSTLAQLGCDFVQGFGIARPMAPDDFVHWARARLHMVQDLRQKGG